MGVACGSGVQPTKSKPSKCSPMQPFMDSGMKHMPTAMITGIYNFSWPTPHLEDWTEEAQEVARGLARLRGVRRPFRWRGRTGGNHQLTGQAVVVTVLPDGRQPVSARSLLELSRRHKVDSW